MTRSNSRTALIIITMFLLLSIWLPASISAQGNVRAVVVNEFANVRTAPAIGAEVIDSVSAGYEFNIVTARSGDNEWIRVDFQGFEGWVNITPLLILQGDISSLPVADPRTIPYGGFEAPRAGISNAQSNVIAIATNNVRLRMGPSTAYPTLANVFHDSPFFVTGRTAGNTWYQISYEGVLGWVYSSFIQFQETGPENLPVDGIVADEAPESDPTANDYVATLKRMLARLDIAQGSLDQIRGSWTDAALNGRAICQSYPARPSDLHIPTPLLAAFYPTLNPLMSDFNDAMHNVRLPIDLFIEVCNQPGTGNPVGTATVQGALDVVNLADSQFANLRARLRELIPPDVEIGIDQCMLVYAGQSEILPVIALNTIYIDEMDPRNTANGYCFDATEGQSLMFQTLQLPGSTLVHFLSVAPFDNPTDFIAVGSSQPDTESLIVSPVRIPTTGRYLLIVADLPDDGAEVAPLGDYAVAVLDITTSTLRPEMVYNPDTGQVTVQTPVDTTGTITGDTTVPGDTTGVVCPSLSFTCNQLFTCQEAQSCLAAGNFTLDPDGDGIPCEENLCGSP